MAKYVLSPAAQISLRKIKDYSTKNFGSQKSNTYLLAIREHMQFLAASPFAGLIREDINAAYYSSFVGSHTIYYRIQPHAIEVIDVLHQSMEPSKHIN